MKVRLSPEADGDLDDIYAYLAPLNPAAAGRMLERLLDAAWGLSHGALHGRPGRVEGTREKVVENSPYLLIYRIDGQTVEIARVLHGARRWPPGG